MIKSSIHIKNSDELKITIPCNKIIHSISMKNIENGIQIDFKYIP